MDTSFVFALILSALMAAVFFYDLTRYIIPNWLNLAVLLLFVPFALLKPEAVDWPMALAALGVVFAVGFALFACKVMGAGDIKLLCALALWCGFSKPLLMLLVYTALLGGVLAAGVYVLRLMLPAFLTKTKAEAKIPRLLTHGEPVPYGLAISVGFLLLVWGGEMPGLSDIGVGVLAGAQR